MAVKHVGQCESTPADTHTLHAFWSFVAELRSRVSEKLTLGFEGVGAGQGSIPGRVETLGSVSVNHILTGPGCKNGTSECGEDRIMCPALHGMFGGDTVPIHLRWWLTPRLGRLTAGKLSVKIVNQR